MKISRKRIRTGLGAGLCAWVLAVTAQASAGDLELQGKAFRAKVDAACKAEPSFQRFLDITDVCKKAGLEGKTVDEVNLILRAAGQDTDLVRGAGTTAQQDDLVGGFLLVKGLSYGSVLNIVLQAPFPPQGGTRRVAGPRLCLIVSTNL